MMLAMVVLKMRVGLSTVRITRLHVVSIRTMRRQNDKNNKSNENEAYTRIRAR